VQVIRAEEVQQLNKKQTAVALGTFDGLHRGHQRILSLLEKHARDYLKVVYTFENLPANVFLQKKRKTLFTAEEKIRAFSAYPIDFLLVQEFTKEFASIEAADFADYLLNELNAKVIVVGFNYTFGKDGRGTADFLKAYGEERGCRVIISGPVADGADAISSSRIRNFLMEGNIKEANRLLGYPYTMVSKVVSGKQLGRTYGFPTANFALRERKLVPKNGVYITKVFYRDSVYVAITNIGTRPTVDDSSLKNVETHIIGGFNEEIYGETLKVEFLEFIRPERRFESLMELKEQLARDLKIAVKFAEENF